MPLDFAKVGPNPVSSTQRPRGTRFGAPAPRLSRPLERQLQDVTTAHYKLKKSKQYDAPQKRTGITTPNAKTKCRNDFCTDTRPFRPDAGLENLATLKVKMAVPLDLRIRNVACLSLDSLWLLPINLKPINYSVEISIGIKVRRNTRELKSLNLLQGDGTLRPDVAPAAIPPMHPALQSVLQHLFENFQ
ncbi:hypothetical protein RRG08_034046 [Elysia crispata]|uniref:Uncharacterized protein n=1 Tax=Elysia crispata TaxID=231223 RepID=A0AAE0YL09_9GAST|nr:hypothetical protein RRG08_034046 [Elysia crispata]